MSVTWATATLGFRADDISAEWTEGVSVRTFTYRCYCLSSDWSEQKATWRQVQVVGKRQCPLAGRFFAQVNHWAFRPRWATQLHCPESGNLCPSLGQNVPVD